MQQSNNYTANVIALIVSLGNITVANENNCTVNTTNKVSIVGSSVIQLNTSIKVGVK